MSRFVLVTGSSSGIGKSAAFALAARGYHILAGVRSQKDADELLAGGQTGIHPVLLDVTDDESIAQAVRRAEVILGDQPLVAIVNNAGIAVSGPVLYVPLEAWHRQMDVNVLGVVRVTQRFFPLLSRAANGKIDHPCRIINISSVSGLFASPFVAPYAASKYALEAISDSLRRELYMYAIEVVLIEAGSIATQIWDKAKESPMYSGPEYDPILSSRSEMVDRQMNQAMSLDIMDDLIVKIIGQKRVRVRYLLRRKKWKFHLLRWLPTKWVDQKIHKVLRSKSGQ